MRIRPQIGRRSAMHKNPLFALSDLYEPQDIQEIFDFCRKIVLTNHIVSAALHKMSESPVTALEYNHPDDDVKERYRVLYEEKLRFRERMLEMIFDLVTYSNAFASVSVPVTRYLVSPEVDGFDDKVAAYRSGAIGGREFDNWYAEASGDGRARRIPSRYKIETVDWTVDGNGFRGRCPKTGRNVKFTRIDRYYPNAENIRIKRWDPTRMVIEHRETTDESTYYYNMKRKTRELIRLGDRETLNTTPWEYIVAARTSRNVKIEKANLYHLSNVKISGAFPGWGVPRLYSAFRMIYYYMTLLRANQAIAVGKINDLNILFPATQGQGQMAGMDPAAAIPGSSFGAHMRRMIKAHQKDPNFTGVSPIPVGVTSVFGNGRMQLLSGELDPVTRAICTAMGLPYDMLYGGGAYTGQAVAQRVFSAQTGLHVDRFNEFLAFVKNLVSRALGRENYPPNCEVSLQEPEGPDAQAQKQTIIELALNNRASNDTALKQVGLNWDDEAEQMEKEARKMMRIQSMQAKGQAHAEAAGQEIVTRAQMRMQEQQAEQQMSQQQEAQQEQQAPYQGAVGEPAHTEQDRVMAAEVLAYIEQSPGEAEEVLEMVAQQYPGAYAIIEGELAAAQGGAPQQAQQDPQAQQVQGQQAQQAPSSMDAPMMDAPMMDQAQFHYEEPSGSLSKTQGQPEALPSRHQ